MLHPKISGKSSFVVTCRRPFWDDSGSIQRARLRKTARYLQNPSNESSSVVGVEMVIRNSSYWTILPGCLNAGCPWCDRESNFLDCNSTNQECRNSRKKTHEMYVDVYQYLCYNPLHINNIQCRQTFLFPTLGACPARIL